MNLNTLNYNRAGRSGVAYSLISGDELAYFVDLQLFLGNSINQVPLNGGGSSHDWHNLIGSVRKRYLILLTSLIITRARKKM